MLLSENNLNRKIGLTIAGILLLSIILLGYFLVNNINQAWLVEYIIKPLSVKEQSLWIKVRLIRNPGENQRYISLTGNGNPEIIQCRDNIQRPVNWKSDNICYRIGPISKDANWVEFSYRAKLGKFTGHGLAGALYDDMLVFNGENALLLPYPDSEMLLDRFDRFVRKLTVKVELLPGWKGFLPYQQPISNGRFAAMILQKPAWAEIFNLNKSCFALGNFTIIPVKRKQGSLRVFLDPSFRGRYPREVISGVSRLYDFYAGVFKSGLTDYPIVILGKDRFSQKTIRGGIGGQSLGFTFIPTTGAHWQSFSHSLYHGFFDQKVRARNLRFPPNLWLYRGLATYYENRSLDALPASIKQKYDLNTNSGFRKLYRRYFYFRLKEPPLYAVSPMMEAQLSGGQPEFIHYTLGPLLIKTVIDTQKQSDSDYLLRYILKRADAKAINIEAMLNTVLKERAAEFSRNFIKGATLLPIPKFNHEPENPLEITRRLDEFEALLCSWFRTENPDFPYDKVFLYDPEKVIAATDARGVTFAPPEVEKEIRAFSPTLFILLRQNALRLNVTGETTTDSSLRFKLLYQRQNVELWEKFIIQKRL